MSDEELQQMDKEQLLGIIKAQRFEISILKDDKEHLGEFLKEKDEEIERLNNIIKEVKDYIRSKSIKFTMAYVEDDGRIDLSRSDYRIDKLTSKQVKELLEILDKEN